MSTAETALRRQYLKLCDIRDFDDPGGPRAHRRHRSRPGAAGAPPPQELGVRDADALPRGLRRASRGRTDSLGATATGIGTARKAVGREPVRGAVEALDVDPAAVSPVAKWCSSSALITWLASSRAMCGPKTAATSYACSKPSISAAQRPVVGRRRILLEKGDVVPCARCINRFAVQDGDRDCHAGVTLAAWAARRCSGGAGGPCPGLTGRARRVRAEAG
jgi:hypothetical protein